MVHHVHIALPDAPSIRAIAHQRCDFVLHSGRCQMLETVPDVECPPVRVIQIVFASRIEAGRLDGTIDEASRPGSLRGSLGAELGVASIATHRYGFRATLQPRDQVKVVAALGHQHRSVTVLSARPLSSNERHCHMMVRHIFRCLQGEKIADLTIDDLLADGHIERGIP